ncbi:MAG: hypothetical protein AABX54_03320 [Nanoarchaeota archaeon]
MTKSRNNLVPFSVPILEAIVAIHSGGRLVLSSEKKSLDPTLTQFLNDKGYIDLIRGKTVVLSQKGLKLYETLLDRVSEDIGVRPEDYNPQQKE